MSKKINERRKHHPLNPDWNDNPGQVPDWVRELERRKRTKQPDTDVPNQEPQKKPGTKQPPKPSNVMGPEPTIAPPRPQAPPVAPPKETPSKPNTPTRRAPKRGPLPGRRDLPMPDPKATAKEIRLVKSIISRYNSLIIPKAQLNEEDNELRRSDLKNSLEKQTLDVIETNAESRIETFFDKNNLEFSGINFMSVLTALGTVNENIEEVMAIERQYKQQLERLAIMTVREFHPYIDAAQIKINAYLGPITAPPPPPQGPPIPNKPVGDEKDKRKLQRRIINTITQGGAYRAQSMHHMRPDTADDVIPKNVGDKIFALNDKYAKILGGTLTVNDIFALSVLYAGQRAEDKIPCKLCQTNPSMITGYNHIEQDPETGGWIINAYGIVYPILLHEIVKGLYEIIGLAQFIDMNDTEMQDVLSYDKTYHEPVDLASGATIYRAVIDAIYDSGGRNVDALIREITLQHMYELKPDPFIKLINAIVTNTEQQFVQSQLARLVEKAQQTARDWENMDDDYLPQQEFGPGDFEDDDDFDEDDVDLGQLGLPSGPKSIGPKTYDDDDDDDNYDDIDIDKLFEQKKVKSVRSLSKKKITELNPSIPTDILITNKNIGSIIEREIRKDVELWNKLKKGELPTNKSVIFESKVGSVVAYLTDANDPGFISSVDNILLNTNLGDISELSTLYELYGEPVFGVVHNFTSSNGTIRSGGKAIDVTLFFERKGKFLGVTMLNMFIDEKTNKYKLTNLTKNTAIIGTPLQTSSKALLEAMMLTVKSFSLSEDAKDVVKKVYGVDPIK